MERSGCGFLAALFHYLLLVGSFAFAMMVTFVLTKRTPWSRKKKIIFYISVFVANWGMYEGYKDMRDIRVQGGYGYEGIRVQGGYGYEGIRV